MLEDRPQGGRRAASRMPAACLALLAALVFAACSSTDRGAVSSPGVDPGGSGTSLAAEPPFSDTTDEPTGGASAESPSGSPDGSPGETGALPEPSETDEGREGEACALLSRAEVEKALGLPVSEPVSSGAEACEYSSSDAGSVVEVRLAPGSAVHTGIRQAFPGGEKVPRLGREAFWVPSVMVVSVLLEEQTLQVQLTVGDDLASKAKEIATTLARTALSRL